MVNTNLLPTPTSLVAAMAGERWHFQAWHRDINSSGASVSNYTSGARLDFN